MTNVFTPEQVARLWLYQFGPWRDPFDPIGDVGLPLHMHPFTCGNRDDHPVVAGDKGVLVPTVRGWICPFCDVRPVLRVVFMKGESKDDPTKV